MKNRRREAKGSRLGFLSMNKFLRTKISPLRFEAAYIKNTTQKTDSRFKAC